MSDAILPNHLLFVSGENNYGWEGTTSATIPATSDSDHVKHFNNIRGSIFGATLLCVRRTGFWSSLEKMHSQWWLPFGNKVFYSRKLVILDGAILYLQWLRGNIQEIFRYI